MNRPHRKPRSEYVVEAAITNMPLKRCRIYYMRAGEGLTWGWISEDGRSRSKDLFSLYFDCVQDARRSGFYVDLEAEPDSAVYMPAKPTLTMRPRAR